MSRAEALAERYDCDFLQVDGYDDCIIGVCSRINQQDVLAYSRSKIIEKLMAEMDDESEQERYLAAVEYFDFNIAGAWMGDLTPCFIDTLEE